MLRGFVEDIYFGELVDNRKESPIRFLDIQDNMTGQESQKIPHDFFGA